jgi:hypothetical protein
MLPLLNAEVSLRSFWVLRGELLTTTWDCSWQSLLDCWSNLVNEAL